MTMVIHNGRDSLVASAHLKAVPDEDGSYYLTWTAPGVPVSQIDRQQYWPKIGCNTVYFSRFSTQGRRSNQRGLRRLLH
ncbi:hypothetical protein [Amycolatopsis ultiminotia]|uniref:hypothetical protein n=1 Tax=Amycolatopsis ultiminotia TaxID=543629 RepID=UPI0031F04C85